MAYTCRPLVLNRIDSLHIYIIYMNVAVCLEKFDKRKLVQSEFGLRNGGSYPIPVKIRFQF